MENYYQQDRIQENIEWINNTIRRFFIIDDITTGKEKDIYHIRYRGKFRDIDTETAYQQLENSLKDMDLSPMFREENNQQVIYLIDRLKIDAKSNNRTNLILFIITLISVWITGGLYAYDGQITGINWEIVKSILLNGWPFAISMIAILGAHEMGHYFAGRKHGVNVTLPYFIPLPLISPFGTMGAFINMKGMPKNKKQLFDIGIAGPLSGLLVAIPVLMIGLSLSTVHTLPKVLPEGAGLQLEGNSILYLLLKYITFGKLLPAPASYGSISQFEYWIRYFFTGQPIPLGGTDVMLHQVAWAGWAGLLVTALNLIPIGQLDGGHISNSIFGKYAQKIFFPLILFMVALGFVWSGWWFWAFLIFFLGRIPAAPYDMITPLDTKRKIIGVITLIIFVLVFIPVPIVVIF